MKKYKSIIILTVIIIGLTACKIKTTENHQQALPSLPQNQIQVSTTEPFPDFLPTPEPLSKRVIKQSSPNQTVEIYEDFSLTINQIKIIEEEMPASYIETAPYLVPFFKDHHFYYLELTVIVVNNREESIFHPGFEYVVTDQRQQIPIFHEAGQVKWPSTFQPGTSTTINEYHLRLLPNNLEELTKFIFWTPYNGYSEIDLKVEPVAIEIRI
ncbi:hypothetical protein ACWN8P_01420 [Vagococcus salmoninarum]|uniref:Uncharacterized protein n=3 Tax=Vagococcus salmoninarum TaxID=2739 RepID=A0A429ZUN0_9ENTE|nr:hypothetical protein [Vagococcus salmoninarum]RST97411.1 hypothetical protein CBF35_01720 [Vagococcus salmoninarum]